MNYKILSFFFSCTLLSQLRGQTVQSIVADSIKVTNATGSAELIIENSTKQVPGYLFNRGNGRTEFKQPLQKVSDSIYLVGVDTLRMPYGPFVSLTKSETIPSVKVFAPNIAVTGTSASGTIFSPTFVNPPNNSALVSVDFRKPLVTNPGNNTYKTYSARFQDRVIFDSLVTFPGGTFDHFGLRSNTLSAHNNNGTFYIYKPSGTGTAAQLLSISASYTIRTTGNTLTAGTVFNDSVTFSGGTQDYAQIKAIPSLAQQGNATGPLRGIYVLPGLTGISDFRGVEVKVNAGEGYAFYAAGTAPSKFGGLLQYAGNFSAGYTDRSLVDKGYIDSLLYGSAAWKKTTNSNNIFYPGSVGIGGQASSDTTVKLTVHGAMLAKRIKILATGLNWPDYVFEDNYKTMSPDSLRAYINTHKHLPDMPSAGEAAKNGIDIASMQAALLKKVEELTLLLIQQEKMIQEQAVKIAHFEKLYNANPKAVQP